MTKFVAVGSPLGRHTSGLFALAAAVALAASAAPLLVYSISLAVFGLPHVLSEMRYVDARFHRRIRSHVGSLMIGLLVSLMLCRIVAIYPGIQPRTSTIIQLSLLIGLVITIVPMLARRGPLGLAFGWVTIGLLGTGILLAPTTTLILMALTHNLTPIGFLAERLNGAERRRAMLLCAVVFLGVPALIFSGLPATFLTAAGTYWPDVSPLTESPLAAHLGSFVPTMWHETSHATRLFSAAAYLQCAHYAVVVYWLPRLLRPPDRPRASFPWPDARRFYWLLIAASAVFFLGFSVDFEITRSLYGVAAAAHAWIEVPLLLLAIPATRTIGKQARSLR